jgi:GTPase SAR1 family protein
LTFYINDGFLLVFSVTDRSSFINIHSIIERIYDTKKTQNVPMILIGNKSDDIDNRVVSSDEATEYAKEVGIPYIETSAKCRTNVDEMFHELIRIMRKQSNARYVKQKPKRVGCILT